MDHTIVRVFTSLDQAEKAREALLAAGFDRALVELTVSADEAGAVKGNFTVGDRSDDDDGPVYERDFAKPVGASDFLITVAAPAQAEAESAAFIMHRFGGHDPDPLKRPR